MENQENDRNPNRQDSGAQNPNDFAHDQSATRDDQNPTNYHQDNQDLNNQIDMDENGRIREGVNNNAGLNDSPHGDNYHNETGNSAGVENRNQAQQEFGQQQGEEDERQADRDRREENREDGHSTII